MQTVVAGGVESISLVQNAHMNAFRQADPIVLQARARDLHGDDRYRRGGVEALQDLARGAGRVFVPESAANLRSAGSRPVQRRDHRDHGDQALRGQEDRRAPSASRSRSIATNATGPAPRSEGLASLPPVKGPGGFITAGNASQLSDGASVCVLMERKQAEQRGLQPLGIYRGMAVAGCEPDEMGIGPVFAVPKLLERNGLQDGRHRPVGTQRGIRRAR